ncbi:MAG: SMC family ATPase [Theionarchaea archaeon]|nr:SMC family ATPase [Theionarchaea archaeon]
MILDSILLYNFKKYKKIKISLGNSLIGIFGNNGAGKSSLFEAVTWSLFGVAQSMEGREGVKQQDLIRDGQEEMGVEIEFSLSGHEYKVARYVNMKRGVKSRLWIDGKLQAQKSREVISRVEEILGVNAKGFVSSSFIRQKELDLITSAIASERKRLINRLFNLRVYEKFEEKAKNARKEKKNEHMFTTRQIQEQEKELESLPVKEKELSELKETVSNMYTIYKNVEVQAETIATSYRQIEKEYRTYSECKSQLELVNKEIESIETTKQEKEKELKEIEHAVNRKKILEPEYTSFLALKEKVSALEERKKTYDIKMNQMQKLETELTLTKKNLKERIVECQKDITDYTREKEELSESSKKITEIKAKIAQYDQVSSLIEETLDKLNKLKDKETAVIAEKAQNTAKISELNEELKNIQSIGIGAPCPTCKRPLEESHYEELLSRYTQDISREEKAREKLDARLNLLLDMKSELQASLTALKKEEKILGKLKTEEKKWMEAEIRLKTLDKNIHDREKKIRECEENITKLQIKKDEIGLIEKEIKLLDFDPEKYNKIKKDIDAKKHVEREMIQLEERISKKESISQSIHSLDEKLQEKNKIRREKTEMFDTLKGIPEKYEDIKKKNADIIQKKLNVSQEYTQKKTQYEERAKELERLQTMKKELQKKIQDKKEIEDMIEIYGILQEAFKKIPVTIQSRLRPHIRKETSELLSEVTDGKYPYINLEKDYSLTVYYDGTYYPISRFSGGEKDLINLCLRVGISRVLVSLSSQKNFARIQSLFLDECFGSFDIERRNNLLGALNQLRKYFAQIILISHIEDIKEALPESFYVEETGDGTSIIKKIK